MSRWARVFFGWTPTRWSLGVTVVLALAGVLFALSFATANGTEIRGGDRDLPSQIMSLSRQVQAKTEEIKQLSDEVTAITTAQAPANAQLRVLQATAARFDLAGGTSAVQGPGVTVSLDDAKLPGGVIPAGYTAQDVIVHQQDVQAVVNALWRGGAEAMMIQNQRIISTSAVRCVGNTLILEGVVSSPPYVITAIGDPSRMQAALEADQAVSIYREVAVAVGLGYTETASTGVKIPAYAGPVSLSYARLGAG